MSLLKRIGGSASTIGESNAAHQRSGGGIHEPAKLSGAPREREDTNFVDIRSRVQNKLIGELDPKLPGNAIIQPGDCLFVFGSSEIVNKLVGDQFG